MKKIISRIVVLAVWLMAMSIASDALAAQAKKTRFVDNGDGTITDSNTGLMWEKKTGTVGASIACSTPTTCLDASNVNNRYNWSDSGSAADGALFDDFLAKMNCAISSTGACGPGGYTDWRVPTIAELRTILPAEFPSCSTSPCIDLIFGPTWASVYWSSTTNAGDPGFAWGVNFGGGNLVDIGKSNFFFARAVRGGR